MFCYSDGHTIDLFHMNLGSSDHHLLKSLLDTLSVTSKDKVASSTSSGTCSGKSPEIKIAGLFVEKSTVLSSTKPYIEMYAKSETICHPLCFRAVFVSSSLYDVSGRTILIADNKSVTGTQQDDSVLPFGNGNVQLRDLQLVPDPEYNLVSVGRLTKSASMDSSAPVMCASPIGHIFIRYGERNKKFGLYTLPDTVILLSTSHALFARKDDLAHV